MRNVHIRHSIELFVDSDKIITIFPKARSIVFNGGGICFVGQGLFVDQTPGQTGPL